MSKRKEIEIKNLEITDAGAEGNCIGRHEGAVVFVPYVVPGDVVDVIAKKKHSYYEGRVTHIVSFSPDRVEALCQHSGICGGCKWQQMKYEKQLYYKQKQVFDHFTRIGKFPFPEIRPIIASTNIFNYRNKIEYTFSDRKWLSKADLEKVKSGENADGTADVENKTAMDNIAEARNTESIETRGLGFHLPSMFDKILDIEYCHLHSEKGNHIRNAIRDYAIQQNLTFWHARKQEGLLRNLILRRATTGDYMLIMVFSEWNAQSQGLMEFIQTRFPAITSLLYVINNKQNDSISDLEVHLFGGKDHIMEQMRDLQFKVSPLAFYQTNAAQALALYSHAAELANIQPHEAVYDLYTGTGTIALFVARNARKVTGIEYVPSAVEDAKVNARLNNIDNVEFVAGDMAKIFTDNFITSHGKPDVIITDPPRAGMHQQVVNQILKIEPKRIVYVSCNSATQARDIALLTEKYEVSAVQPVDMFPHTQHVENIALLIKRTH